VVEAVQQLGLALEAEVAVVGLVALLDLVGHLADAPVVGFVERAGLLDRGLDLSGQALASLVGGLGVDHQD
jgi:hypothetical protein